MSQCEHPEEWRSANQCGICLEVVGYLKSDNSDVAVMARGKDRLERAQAEADRRLASPSITGTKS